MSDLVSSCSWSLGQAENRSRKISHSRLETQSLMSTGLRDIHRKNNWIILSLSPLYSSMPSMKNTLLCFSYTRGRSMIDASARWTASDGICPTSSCSLTSSHSSGKTSGIRSGHWRNTECKRADSNPTSVFCASEPGIQKKKCEKTSCFGPDHFRRYPVVASLLHRNFIKVDLPAPGFPETKNMPRPSESHVVRVFAA